MLVWCSNCYRFMGESPPYKNLAVEYDNCLPCKMAGSIHKRDQEVGPEIKRLMYSLWNAGTQNNLEQGLSVISEALNFGFRPVDIAMGMLAPLLYQIGDDWEKGLIKTEDETRFSNFVDCLFRTLSEEVKAQSPDRFKGEKPKILLLNAENNFHNLGIRLLEIWFQSSGIFAHALVSIPRDKDLVEIVQDFKPEIIGISVCLEVHLSSLKKLVKTLLDHFSQDNLQIMVGGYAVKTGQVPSLPGVILVPDIRMLSGALVPKLEHLPS